MEARLTKIKSGSNAVTPEESTRITKEHQDTVRHWRKRKRMVSHNILTTILEIGDETISFISAQVDEFY